LEKPTCRLAWATDIHLNFVWDRDRQVFDAEYQQFINEIRAAQVDALLISGDIAEASDLVWHLETLQMALDGLRIFFVLGNHDFYGGSVRAVREAVVRFCAEQENLVYLSNSVEPCKVGRSVAVVGHDGWADGRFGQLERSRARISDLARIEDLIQAGESGRRRVMNELADQAAAHLKTVLLKAVACNKELVLLTHVPPWLEVAQYRGNVCDYEYAPYFASKVTGETINEIMSGAPDCQLIVLCGHTHSAAQYRPSANILCLAGASEYGEPRMQRVFEMPQTS